MNWYKMAGPCTGIIIISYDDCQLNALVDGTNCIFNNVSEEDFKTLNFYLKFWMSNKARNLLNTFQREMDY
jgi:hypothetical protein